MSMLGTLARRGSLLVFIAATASVAVDAQQSFTAADYVRAEKLMGYNTTPLVLHSAGRATWISDSAGERFWYRTTTETGTEAFLVDADDGAKRACDLPACRAAVNESGRASGPPTRVDTRSPDGKRTVFIRDWNLWVRDITTGKETQLTKDGVKDFG